MWFPILLISGIIMYLSSCETNNGIIISSQKDEGIAVSSQEPDAYGFYYQNLYEDYVGEIEEDITSISS